MIHIAFRRGFRHGFRTLHRIRFGSHRTRNNPSIDMARCHRLSSAPMGPVFMNSDGANRDRGRNHSPAQNRSRNRLTRENHPGLQFRCFGEGQNYSLAAIGTPRNMIEHRAPLGFGQQALAKRGQNVRIRMPISSPRSAKSLQHDFCQRRRHCSYLKLSCLTPLSS